MPSIAPINLYLPEKASGPLPVIVWVHGGGWKDGNKRGPSFIGGRDTPADTEKQDRLRRFLGRRLMRQYQGPAYWPPRGAGSKPPDAGPVSDDAAALARYPTQWV